MAGIIYRQFDEKVLMFVDSSYKGSPLLLYTPDIMIISKCALERYRDKIRIDETKCKVIEIE